MSKARSVRKSLKRRSEYSPNNMHHNWNVTPTEAVAIQRELKESVSIEAFSQNIHTIAGVDVSLNMFEKDIYAGIIILSYPDMTPIKQVTVKSRTDFPYIPGLLSFREIPALLECFAKLDEMPDVVMVDGQGIAHPRRLGIAAHLGVLLGIPTIGCGKSRLYGTYDVPTIVGEANDILDPKTGEVIGKALKSKARSNPLIISPGHRMSVEDALRITRDCLRGYRLPEPTRRAHLLVNESRRAVDNKN